MQKFLGQSPWEYQPLLTELARQVGQELGEADAVLVLDPSAFAKKGAESVGVARQWCGRLGKLENCQVGVYLAYVYYLRLFKRIKQLPVYRILSERVRVPDNQKFALLIQTYFRYQFNFL